MGGLPHLRSSFVEFRSIEQAVSVGDSATSPGRQLDIGTWKMGRNTPPGASRLKVNGTTK